MAVITIHDLFHIGKVNDSFRIVSLQFSHPSCDSLFALCSQFFSDLVVSVRLLLLKYKLVAFLQIKIPVAYFHSVRDRAA